MAAKNLIALYAWLASAIKNSETICLTADVTGPCSHKTQQDLPFLQNARLRHRPHHDCSALNLAIKLHTAHWLMHQQIEPSLEGSAAVPA